MFSASGCARSVGAKGPLVDGLTTMNQAVNDDFERRSVARIPLRVRWVAYDNLQGHPAVR